MTSTEFHRQPIVKFDQTLEQYRKKTTFQFSKWLRNAGIALHTYLNAIQRLVYYITSVLGWNDHTNKIKRV